MRWKIWKEADAEMCRELNACRKQVQIERDLKLEAKLEAQERLEMIEELREQLKGLQRLLEVAGVFNRLADMPVSKPELLEALKAVTPTTEWWRAVHALINDQEQLNVGALCVATEQGELAHFNRGRASALRDLRAALLQHAAEAQAQAPG